MSGGGAKTDCSSPFQCTGSEQEVRKHINWLELRAAQYPLLELGSPGDVVLLDNIMAITFIRKMGAPAPYPCAKKATCCDEKTSGGTLLFLPLSDSPHWGTQRQTSSADTDCRGGTDLITVPEGLP